MSQWSVFGVDITPKFTDDIKNVLKVTSKKEIFFDVYECTYNGKNIIVEKVGASDGVPVVSFEAVKNNKKYKCEALLVESEESELFLNENHLEFLKSIQKTPIKTIIEEKVEKVIPTNTVYEDEVRDVSEKIIKESQEKAQKLYDNKLKEYKKHKQLIAKQAEEYLNEKTESIRQELYEQYIDFLSSNDKKVNNLVKSNIDDITLSIDENNKEILSKVDKLSNLNKEELAKILSENIINININLDSKVKYLNDQLDIILHDSNTKLNKLDEKTSRLLEKNIKHTDEIVKNITSKIEQVDEKIEDYKIDTFKHVVEKVADNKTEIEASLKNTISKINEQVDIKRDEVEKILAAELSNINEKLNIFSEEEDKKYKQLLENLNNLNKGEVKEILSEKINDKQLNSLKLDISKQFQNEMMSIKRLIEMSSGGGSVAKQFANGGTMDGSLNVTQNILSGGTNLLDIFNTDTSIDLQDVTDNGNTTTNSISSSGTVFGDIGSFTTLNALTANFTQTIVSTTSALSVINDGTGPALYVQQSGNEPVATFVDKEGGTVIIDDRGNVGIGTTSPQAKLHVKDGSALSNNVVATFETSQTTGDADAYLEIKARANGEAGILFSNQNNTNSNGFLISHGDAFSEALYVWNQHSEELGFLLDQNGNFGIGTSTPSEKLEVDGGILSDSLQIGSTPAYSQTRAIKLHDNGVQFGARVSLIGTNDNGGPGLEMVTDGNLSKRTLIRHEGEGSNDYGLSFYTTNNSTVSEKVRFDGDGNVGIGTSTPSAKLDVSGNVNIDGILTLIDQGNDGLKTITANNNDLTFNAVHGIFGYSIGLRGNRGSILGMESAGSILDISAPSDITLTPGGDTEIQSDLTVNGDTLISGDLTVTNRLYLPDSDGIFDHYIIAERPDQSVGGLRFYGGNQLQAEISNGGIASNGFRRLTSNTTFRVQPDPGSNSNGVLVEYAGTKSNSGTFSLMTIGDNSPTLSNSGGIQRSLSITPTYNQTSSTASNTDLFINRTETSIGSGDQFLIQAQTDGVDMLTVDNTGELYVAGNVGIGTDTPAAKLQIVGGDLDVGQTGENVDRKITIHSQNAANKRAEIGYLGGTFGIRPAIGNQTFVFGSTSIDNMLFAADASTGVLRFNTANSEAMRIDSNGNVGIGTDTPSAKLEVVGHFTATTKSFLVDKPNGGKLQYGVTESNEHSVFVRGKTDQETIKLPEEWEWLVNEDSVTVTVTPVGKFQPLYVISQSNNEVKVGGVEGEYNYIIYGTRKDVAPLEVNV